MMALACSAVITHPTNVTLHGVPASCKTTRGSEHGISDSEYHGDSIESHILNEVVQLLFETPLKVTPHKSK